MKSCANDCIPQKIGGPNIGYKIIRCCQVDLCNVIEPSPTTQMPTRTSTRNSLTRLVTTTSISNAANDNDKFCQKMNSHLFQIMAFVYILMNNIFLR
jgi:hypothetical protein